MRTFADVLGAIEFLREETGSERATSHQFRYDPRLTVFDAIGDCDVPQFIAALDDRDLQIDRTHRDTS